MWTDDLTFFAFSLLLTPQPRNLTAGATIPLTADVSLTLQRNWRRVGSLRAVLLTALMSIIRKYLHNRACDEPCRRGVEMRALTFLRSQLTTPPNSACSSGNGSGGDDDGSGGDDDSNNDDGSDDDGNVVVSNEDGMGDDDGGNQYDPMEDFLVEQVRSFIKI